MGDTEVEIELDSFSGRLALLHHVRSSGTEDALVLKGRALRLERRGPGSEPRIPDSDEITLGKGRHVLTVIASGKYQQAFVDQTARLYGHEPSLKDGRVGLEIEGRGALRIYRWRVRPVRE